MHLPTSQRSASRLCSKETDSAGSLLSFRPLFVISFTFIDVRLIIRVPFDWVGHGAFDIIEKSVSLYIGQYCTQTQK